MKIGLMVDSYKPYVSGITNYVDLNKRYFEQAGHEVFVFTFGDLNYDDGEKNVIRSRGVPLADSGFYLSMRYSRNAKKLLQSMDIVHVQHPFLSGRLALRYCKDIPIVYTNHTRYDLYAQAYLPIMPDEMSQGLLQAYMPSFCNAVDMVIAPSAGMKKVLRQLNVERDIEVVPNGVELKDFQSAVPLPRAAFGFRDDDLLLVYAGRLAPEKNIPFLLKSFAGVAEALPNAYLLLLGSGIQVFEEEIRALAGELQLGDRIRFTGRIPYDKLPAYLAMCDIFVTASITEVHPLSVIEAMGAGLPVMGVESVGVGDTVENGVTGFLSTHEIAAFTAKLTRLCIDTDLRRKMSNATRSAASVYDIEQVSKILLGHYERIVKEARPRKGNWALQLQKLLESFAE